MSGCTAVALQTTFKPQDVGWRMPLILFRPATNAGGLNANCTTFRFDASHLKAAPVSPALCPIISKNATIYCVEGTQELWIGLPCAEPCHIPPPPPAPPPAPAPPPPSPCSDGGSKQCSCAATNVAKPRFHITGLSGGAHDVNAVFKWRGRVHVMNQRN
eukprot:SAG31_NODE_22001_length_536_cov_0.656751_1_plen_158_part_01